ncbi:MAG: ThiF family adenylyltransferase [Brotaphodocola sp.]
MMQEFSRTERLIGTTNQQKLYDSTVIVFGIGGVGSHCTEALARGGIGHLILVDNDVVSITNINRQSIAFHSTIGKYKTKIMKERILDINPQAAVETIETFILPENLKSILDNIKTIDYIVDAIDTVTAKLALAEYAAEHKIPLISSMGTGNKLHGELFEITDIFKTSVCPLCRVMRKELKARGIHHLKVLYSKEQPLTPLLPNEESSSKRAVPGSVSFVPPVAGLLIAGEVIRELTGVK